LASRLGRLAVPLEAGVVGAVGYFYNQLTADNGQLAILGDKKSRVVAVGPQIGYLFPVGDMRATLT
jgi:hypothetical protein